MNKTMKGTGFSRHSHPGGHSPAQLRGLVRRMGFRRSSSRLATRSMTSNFAEMMKKN